MRNNMFLTLTSTYDSEVVRMLMTTQCVGNKKLMHSIRRQVQLLSRYQNPTGPQPCSTSFPTNKSSQRLVGFPRRVLVDTLLMHCITHYVQFIAKPVHMCKKNPLGPPPQLLFAPNTHEKLLFPFNRYNTTINPLNFLKYFRVKIEDVSLQTAPFQWSFQQRHLVLAKLWLRPATKSDLR